MGAGVVKAQAANKDITNSTTSSTPASQSTTQTGKNNINIGQEMAVCFSCRNNFGLFKKKKRCAECGLDYCSNCLQKSTSPEKRRSCAACTKLVSGNFTRHELLAFKIKHLRAFLEQNNVPIINCSEKNDLIELVLVFSKNSQYLRQQAEQKKHLHVLQRRQRERETQSLDGEPLQSTAAEQSEQEEDTISITQESNHSPDSPSDDTAPSSSELNIAQSGVDPPNTELAGATATQSELNAEERAEHLRRRQEQEMREAEIRLADELQTDQPDARPPLQRMTLEGVDDLDSIEDLSIRQLKEVLVSNFVDYKGCVEKWELVERVKRLWKDHRINAQKINELDQSDSVDEKEVCKVCMDAIIDCVLLECGHIITCTKCGKQLAECPICRQFVSRVVRIYKA